MDWPFIYSFNCSTSQPTKDLFDWLFAGLMWLTWISFLNALLSIPTIQLDLPVNQMSRWFFYVKVLIIAVDISDIKCFEKMFDSTQLHCLKKILRAELSFLLSLLLPFSFFTLSSIITFALISMRDKSQQFLCFSDCVTWRSQLFAFSPKNSIPWVQSDISHKCSTYLWF